jgi:hypothetical protein
MLCHCMPHGSLEFIACTLVKDFFWGGGGGEQLYCILLIISATKNTFVLCKLCFDEVILPSFVFVVVV